MKKKLSFMIGLHVNIDLVMPVRISTGIFFVRARPCFQDGVFRVPKNGMLETNKPLAMRVVGNALAYRKNLQCYNNAGSPTALQAEEVSIWI